LRHFFDLRDFLDLLNIDWYEELDKSESYRNNSTFELDEKINFVKKTFLHIKRKLLTKYQIYYKKNYLKVEIIK